MDRRPACRADPGPLGPNFADEFVLKRQLAACGAYNVIDVDCPPSLGLLTLNAFTAASHLVIVTEPTFLALQGIEELLETQALGRTVEHCAGMAEIVSVFGPSPVWSPTVPKRTVLQHAVRAGRHLADCRSCAARELTHAFSAFAERIEA
jgi:chromosome partitioning protein